MRVTTRGTNDSIRVRWDTGREPVVTVATVVMGTQMTLTVNRASVSSDTEWVRWEGATMSVTIRGTNDPVGVQRDTGREPVVTVAMGT